MLRNRAMDTCGIVGVKFQALKSRLEASISFTLRPLCPRERNTDTNCLNRLLELVANNIHDI